MIDDIIEILKSGSRIHYAYSIRGILILHKGKLVDGFTIKMFRELQERELIRFVKKHNKGHMIFPARTPYAIYEYAGD